MIKIRKGLWRKADMMFNMHPEWLRGVEINVALGSNS
jgi:hypothetical protein